MFFFEVTGGDFEIPYWINILKAKKGLYRETITKQRKREKRLKTEWKLNKAVQPYMLIWIILQRSHDSLRTHKQFSIVIYKQVYLAEL
jgi:hypothetical protein